jgi:hypothetical protein
MGLVVTFGLLILFSIIEASAIHHMSPDWYSR